MAKAHKEDYGNYILNNKEILLKKKKKIIIIKRTILVLVVLFTILITLALTLPEFNLAEVKVSGTEIIPEEAILETANLDIGTNIFKINTKTIKEAIKENSYVDKVKVTRKYPNTITIEVTERKIAYYIQGKDGNCVIDRTGRVLGIKETIESIEVLRLEGIDPETLVIGELIQGEDSERFEAIRIIYDFLKEKSFFEVYNIGKLEVNDFVDFKLYVNSAYIKLGTSDNMNEKLAKGFSILSSPEYLDLKGYVDVSFEGNPVVFKE